MTQHSTSATSVCHECVMCRLFTVGTKDIGECQSHLAEHYGHIVSTSHQACEHFAKRFSPEGFCRGN